MRVISENRTIDVPYEQSVIWYNARLRKIQADCHGRTYSLKINIEAGTDEAERIISEIRTAYAMGRKVYEIPEKG